MPNLIQKFPRRKDPAPKREKVPLALVKGGAGKRFKKEGQGMVGGTRPTPYQRVVGPVLAPRRIPKAGSFARAVLSPGSPPSRLGKTGRPNPFALESAEGTSLLDMGQALHKVYSPLDEGGQVWSEDFADNSAPSYGGSEGSFSKDFSVEPIDESEPQIVGEKQMDFDFGTIAKSAVGPAVTFVLRGKGALIAIGGGLLAAWAANKFVFGA